MEEQETIALERGQIALDYAVSLLKYSYLHIFDEMYRTLSKQSESLTTVCTKPRLCS